LLEFVNIRNQDSWVHLGQPEPATLKQRIWCACGRGQGTVSAAFGRRKANIAPRALIVGGGISGMASARAISRQGFPVAVIERDHQLGGQARHLYRTAKGKDIQQQLNNLIDEVVEDSDITVYLNSNLEKVEGFVGNFRSTVKFAEQALTLIMV
jgi:heterodisulfide reductase subunit A2